jgi:hypothetical protein
MHTQKAVKGYTVVYRAPEFLTSRSNWVPPIPSPASECVPPQDPKGVGDPVQTTGPKPWHLHTHVQKTKPPIQRDPERTV